MAISPSDRSISPNYWDEFNKLPGWQQGLVISAASLIGFTLVDGARGFPVIRKIFVSDSQAVTKAHKAGTSHLVSTDPQQALCNACIKGDLGGLKQALSDSADIHTLYQSNESGLKLSVLHLAAMHNHKDIIFYLCNERKVPVDITSDGEELRTALYFASVYGKTEAMEALMDCGAKLDSAFDGLTPLIAATLQNQLEAVDLLLKRGAKASIKALFISAAKGQTELAALLVKHGADKTTTNDNGFTAAQIAETLGHTETAKAIS